MLEARVLILPSECYEQFGLAIIEAYSAGLPVIGSRIGAVATLVEEGATGLLHTPGDSEDLAAKVLWAWTNPSAMMSMGTQARASYEKHFSSEVNYRLLREAYVAAATIAAGA